MKRKILCGGLLLIIAALFAGCSNAIPEMNEEERSMVINYAADIVRKYDSNHVTKLQEPTPEPTPEPTEDQTKDNMDENAEEKEPSGTPATETEVIDNTEGNDEPVIATVDDFLKLDGFNFSYEGYEVADNYPQNDTETYFAMGATDGNKLLILKFMAQNNTGAEASLDMVDSGIRFKVQVNGNTKNALVTMLLNDFANYQGVIGAGSSEELVVVSEIQDNQADNIASLNLIIRNEDESATILLH